MLRTSFARFCRPKSLPAAFCMLLCAITLYGPAHAAPQTEGRDNNRDSIREARTSSGVSVSYGTPWVYAPSAARAATEAGVRVFRGAARPTAIAGTLVAGTSDTGEAGDARLEAALAGAASPAGRPTLIREQNTIVIYRNCFRPQPLLIHGFLGERRYNRATGFYQADTFGFNGYERGRAAAC